MSEETNIIDTKKLERYRTATTISGYYLAAWNVLVENGIVPMNLDQHLISFEETEDEVHVYFTRPVTERILGGGNGKFIISKKTFQLLEGGLSK